MAMKEIRKEATEGLENAMVQIQEAVDRSDEKHETVPYCGYRGYPVPIARKITAKQQHMIFLRQSRSA